MRNAKEILSEIYDEVYSLDSIVQNEEATPEEITRRTSAILKNLGKLRDVLGISYDKGAESGRP